MSPPPPQAPSEAKMSSATSPFSSCIEDCFTNHISGLAQFRETLSSRLSGKRRMADGREGEGISEIDVSYHSPPKAILSQ